jgi:hypothetical protein
MSDAESLFFFLATIYLAECAFWVRPGGFVFASFVGGRARRTNLHWALLRNYDGGILLGNVVPIGHACSCQHWPISISPEGVYGYVSQAPSSDGRPDTPERFVLFEDLRRVETEGAHLVLNGQLFVRTASVLLARRLAALLRELLARPIEERSAAIDAALKEHLSVVEVRRRWADYRHATRELRVVGAVLFFVVFCWTPVLLWFPAGVFWEPMLLAYPLLVLLNLILFRSAHRRLYPAERWDRFKNSILVFLSPVDAIHARNKLARHLLTANHPLAVARVLGRADDFESFAAEAWRDVRFPVLPICPVDLAEPQATETWFRERWYQAVASFLRDAEVDVDKALRSPAPETATCRSYCPRCLGQFVLDAGTCMNCARPLVSLFPPTPEMIVKENGKKSPARFASSEKSD